MYDPTIGRWLEEDPMQFEAGDANLYRYVANGPTNSTDPSGLDALTIYERARQDASQPDSRMRRWMDEAVRKAAQMAQGVPIDLKIQDSSGPDVTDWFAKDIVEHIKYRRREQAGINESVRCRLENDSDGGAISAGLEKGSNDAFSFRHQAKYLMSHKWIDFGGPESGRGMNTVRVAGKALYKNQLGNIMLLVIGTLLPTDGGKDFAASYPYVLEPGGATYRGNDPYAKQYGNYKDYPRADNLAAFGVGRAIANRIAQLPSSKSQGVPTVAEVKEILEELFSDDKAMAAAVNTFRVYMAGWPTIDPDALFFSPRYGGFNTSSLQDPKKTYEGSSSLDYFNNVLKPAHDAYSILNADQAKRLRPMSLDDYLPWNRENYEHPKGQHPETPAVYWKR